MFTKLKIYLDTSVISALFDDRNPERKNLTENFFKEIHNFEPYISEVTVAEIEHTMSETLRSEMQAIIAHIPILPLNEDVESLAEKYIQHGAIPKNYAEDAYHIAIAVICGMEFVLSWNFKHLVRKKTRDIVKMVNTLNNLKNIEIITPAELL